MADSGSYTDSFTSADVVKVTDRFAADLVMLTQSSEAMTAVWAENSIHDVKLMAKKDYISRISVVLADSSGNVIKARNYEVSKDASLWSSDRPGDNLWPRTPNGSLGVIVQYTSTWGELGSVAKANFEGDLKQSWGPSTLDTDFPGMSGQQGRRYASNAYGMQRTDYE
jgi:hypothetical protein